MEMSKSEQIRAGLQKSFQSGSSAKASTICFGYKVTQSGKLVIDSIEANIVLFIFHMDSTHKEHFRNMVGNRMMQ